MKNYIYTSIALLILCVSLFPYRTFSDGGNGSLLGNGLVGYWPFDSADYANSTNIVDRSGNGNTGNLVGSPTKVNGKIGQALSFNGTNQSVNMGYILQSLTGSNFTVSFWAKPSSLLSAGAIPVSDGAYATCGFYTYDVTGGSYSNTNVWGMAISGSSIYRIESNTNTATVGVWQLVSFTVSGSTGTVYVNGVNQTVSGSSAGAGSSCTEQFFIGQYSSENDYYFPGSIDDVRIYNRALSAGEINLLYQQGNGSYTGSFLSEMIEEINSIF